MEHNSSLRIASRRGIFMSSEPVEVGRNNGGMATVQFEASLKSDFDPR